ncbi:MAG: NINE protein [Campylobacter sp.]
MNNIYIAYALWFLVGYLGGHRIYLGRFISGFLQMGLFFLGSVTVWFFGIGLIPLGIWGIWWIMDIFWTSKIIDENLRKEILKNNLLNDENLNQRS